MCRRGRRRIVLVGNQVSRAEGDYEADYELPPHGRSLVREDGEPLHVSMLRVAFGPRQRIRVNSQLDV